MDAPEVVVEHVEGIGGLPVGRFGSSSGTYIRDMTLYGPSKYDFIWNYG